VCDVATLSGLRPESVATSHAIFKNNKGVAICVASPKKY